MSNNPERNNLQTSGLELSDDDLFQVVELVEMESTILLDTFFRDPKSISNYSILQKYQGLVNKFFEMGVTSIEEYKQILSTYLLDRISKNLVFVENAEILDELIFLVRTSSSSPKKFNNYEYIRISHLIRVLMCVNPTERCSLLRILQSDQRNKFGDGQKIFSVIQTKVSSFLKGLI